MFLHPRSALARAAPEFVAYTQLVRTAKRPYLAGLRLILILFLKTLTEWSAACHMPTPQAKVVGSHQ